MDKKAQAILKHYKDKFESRSFDEYDIMSFLIFIRNYFNHINGIEIIKDFSHLVAHRKRDRGKIMEAIAFSIKNREKIAKGARENFNYKVADYPGIEYKDWEKEWFKLGDEFNITFTTEIIIEVTMCILSISQFTEYKSEDGKFSGELGMARSENALSLHTTHTVAKNEKPLSIIFFNLLINPSKVIKDEKFKIVDVPIEAVRVNGELKLREVKI